MRYLQKISAKKLAYSRIKVYISSMINNKTTHKIKTGYRIQNEDRTFLNAGTDLGSWFSLEEAKKTVNYNIGQRIVEHDGMRVIWEIL